MGTDQDPDSGLRRRTSTCQDEEEHVVGAQDEADQPTQPQPLQSTYTIPAPQRSNSEPQNATGVSSATGVDAEDVRRPLSQESSPRVRFSLDTDAGGFRSTKGKTPDLTVNTELEDVGTRSSVLSQGTTRSPPVLSPTLSRPIPHDSPTSPTSPTSPQSRSRGYSLRRSLFHRNIEGSPDKYNPGTVIELQEAGPSSLVAGEGHYDPKSPSKKSSETAITIEAVSDFESFSRLSEKKARGFQGPSTLPNYETWLERQADRNGYLKHAKTMYSRVRKAILHINEIPPSKDGRRISLDATRKKALTDERTSKPYVENTIRSSRYTAVNFLPRQLFAQFSKLANFYFLCVSVLQLIPGLSTTGTYTTIVPLLFFVSLSMAKEGYDDLRRYRLDKVENNRKAQVLHADQSSEDVTIHENSDAFTCWKTTKWKDLRVGDIVKLERDDASPSDLILLHSNGPNGIAYVETMALDGETNLKSKQSTTSLAKRCSSMNGLVKCKAEIVVEDPNLDLYNFEGRVTVAGETSPLTNSEIIYRGSVLRNTSSALGMVIYTGEECKIRMNATKNPRIKAPTLQSMVNKVVIVIVFFVIALALFNTIAYQIWRKTTEKKSWYLQDANVAFFPILASFIIMFNTLIPLSLYVSLEIVKLAQMFFLNDVDMYDEVSDTPFEARTSTINEELGQVSYVFSDKTGTLTDNQMKFRKLSVAGTAWLHDSDLKEGADKARLMHKKRSKGKKPVRKSTQMSESGQPRKSGVSAFNPDPQADTAEVLRSPSDAQWKSSARPGKSQPELRTHDLIRYIQHRPYTIFARKARLFLLSIALCHTCLPEIQDNGRLDFQAASPDELALVKGAQEMGYLVINRDVGTLTLRHVAPDGSGEQIEEIYETLDVIEFSSKRKRMSILVRFPDGRVCIFCKGADSVVMQRLKLARLANRKVVEIEKRSNKRKSLEAQVAIARKSEQNDRKNSLSRPSMTLGRSSLNASRLRPVRDELDDWLKERERDVDVETMDDDAAYYSPRPSAQLGRASGISLGNSEMRTSLQVDDLDDLVEESLVVDEPAVIERCFQHINDFATEGLRTLLYGYRFVDDQEYATWKKAYLDATTSLVDRQSKIEQVGEMIEQDLELSGATAIEDKLQKGVPEAIDKLRRANIKMWMLTGDKRETAINIGHSCRLIKDYSTVIVLDHEAGEVEQNIAAAVIGINEGSVAHSVVVVDGQTLAIVDSDRVIQKLFYDLAILADSVICCRASPSQKAALVKAIRKRVKKSVTLAVGDGANDIAMIQEAHVGIGITGKEGLQAARTSDYSIAQFRFLTKLLLVHGRWNYIRTCKYTVGTFWKEMVFYLTQALYQRWAGYTGTSLYESWSLSMFNTLFTSLPVIFMGIFEKDLQASTLLAVPELYTKGQRNGGFNTWIYLGWMFMGSAEAMVIYFTMFGLFGQATFTQGQGLFAMGDLTFTAVVVLISIKMQILEAHNKSTVVAISFIASVGGWFLWNIILAFTYSNNVIYHVRSAFLTGFGRNPTWWLSLILVVASCVIFEIGVSTLRAAYLPQDEDVFQELERDLAIRKRFEEAAATELQQGWDRGKKKSSVELTREREVQVEREGQVREILRNRPEGLDEERAPPTREVGAEWAGRRSMEVQEMLRTRFGNVKKDSMRE